MSVGDCNGAITPALLSQLRISGARLASKHGWDRVAYFLYNQPLEALDADDQRILTALDTDLPDGDGANVSNLLRHNRLGLFQWNPSLAVAAVTEIEAAVGTSFADNVNVSCFAPHVGDLDDTDESLGIYGPDCIFVTLLDA